MSQTDLIGWGSLALFGVFFVVLYRFITTPSRKFEKTLGDGRALGLSRLPRDSPEFEMLVSSLKPFLGTHGKSFRLGSVYRAERGDGYLFSLVEISKVDRPGGTATEHQDHEKVFWRRRNGLSSFVVRRRCTGPGLDLAAKLLEKTDRRVETVESGLSPAFQRLFVVYGGSATGPATVPVALQQIFVEAAGGATQRAGAATAIDEIEGIAFQPDGFLIHLNSRLGSRSLERLRGLLHLAEQIEQHIAR